MSKKTSRRRAHVDGLITYTFPKLHETKSWYIDFFCYDPLGGKMRRKKFHLDRIEGIRQRRKYAADLIHTLTTKLANGWNCWADTNRSKGFHLMSDVFETYSLYLKRMFKTDVIKESTWLSYKSYLFNFRTWLEEDSDYDVTYVYQLSKEIVVAFLDYMFLERDVSARTRNSYKGWLSVFGEFLVEKSYLGENPAAGISKLRVRGKERDAIGKEDLLKLHDFLYEHNKFFLLACMMEYYTFIRPNELTYIRIADIHVKAQKVLVSRTFTKNGQDGAVGLNEEILRLMAELNIFSYPSNFYLFGGKDFRPGIIKQHNRVFRDYFVGVRKVLKWPEAYKFYSLKDAGIRDLANSKGIVIARDQARHSDISTTNKYLKGCDLAVHEETKHFKGNL